MSSKFMFFLRMCLPYLGLCRRLWCERPELSLLLAPVLFLFAETSFRSDTFELPLVPGACLLDFESTRMLPSLEDDSRERNSMFWLIGVRTFF